MTQNNQAIPINKENFKQILSFKFVLVIIISIPSALIADYFGLPLAWFLGPMLVTSVASLAGLKIKIPRLVLSSILVLLGLYIGNYIDKDLFTQIHEWALTSVIMLIYIILSILIVSQYLQKFSKYEKKTSVFSAAPGDLTAARRSLRTAGHTNTRGGVMKRRKEGALCACSLHRGAPLNAALLLGNELY